MTPQERDLIQSVFDRLARLANGPKDREAEALILEHMRSIPDAAYNLVEAVVVQEMAIKERDARIAELERRPALAPQQQAQPAAFGQQPGRNNPWGRGSVPQTQPQNSQAQYGQNQQQGPWGGQPSAGGSFLRTAAGAAVGVAGGMLLANSISSMFGGGHTAAAPAPVNQVADTGAAPGPGPEPSLDTNVADDMGYDGGFDGGFDGGGDF